AWSLSCEFFFYLCFPLMFWWMKDAGWKKIAGVVAVSLVLPLELRRWGVPEVWKPVLHLADFAAGVWASGSYGVVVRRGVLGGGLGRGEFMVRWCGGDGRGGGGGCTGRRQWRGRRRLCGRGFSVGRL